MSLVAQFELLAGAICINQFEWNRRSSDMLWFPLPLAYSGLFWYAYLWIIWFFLWHSSYKQMARTNISLSARIRRIEIVTHLQLTWFILSLSTVIHRIDIVVYLRLTWLTFCISASINLKLTPVSMDQQFSWVGYVTQHCIRICFRDTVPFRYNVIRDRSGPWDLISDTASPSVNISAASRSVFVRRELTGE